MASNINPNNIDTTYPIAGQDNDSQGFRDNFTNIKTNLEYAESEIEDLQNNVLLKAALAGSTLNNNMAGAEIIAATLGDTRLKLSNLGQVSGAVEVDVLAGAYQKMEIIGDVTLSFTNFPGAGNSSSIRVEITVGATPVTVTLPNPVLDSAVGLQGFQGTDLELTQGVYLYEFSTTTQGTSLLVTDLSRSRNNFFRTVATSIGAPGDAQGNFAFDADYAYYCTADYDGTTNIWKRISLSATTW